MLKNEEKGETIHTSCMCALPLCTRTQKNTPHTHRHTRVLILIINLLNQSSANSDKVIVL